MYDEGKVKGGGIQTSAATRSARVHERRVARPKTTRTLKMESRDQSFNGQVGESERHLLDGGSVERKRSGAQPQTLLLRPCGEADMTAGETSGLAGLPCVCMHRPEPQPHGFSVAGGTFVVQLLCPSAVHDHTLTDELAC